MIRNKQDLIEYIEADYKAFGFKHPFLAKFSFSENNTLFNYLKTLRYLEYYLNKRQKFYDKFFRIYYLLKWRYLNKKYQIHITPNVVGKGIHLVHYGYRMIPAIKSIGDNCTILPMVLIGKKAPDVDNSQSKIGSNCYIGAGAIIMTPINIGNNVTIGAGSVVTHDIPNNAIVAGNPAKIISYK